MQNGVNAASLAVAEQYVQAFSKLAKTNNTLILPEKTGDISSMVAKVRETGLVVSQLEILTLYKFCTVCRHSARFQ